MNDVTEQLMLGRLQGVIAWAAILVGLGGAAIVASYIRRSQWAWVVAIGFALLAANQVASRVLIPMIVGRNPAGAATQLGWAVFGLSVVGLVGEGTLVLGVVATLTELTHAKRTREP